MPWKRAPSCATGPLAEGIPPLRDLAILAQRKHDSQTGEGFRSTYFGGFCSLAVVAFFFVAGFLVGFLTGSFSSTTIFCGGAAAAAAAAWRARACNCATSLSREVAMVSTRSASDRR